MFTSFFSVVSAVLPILTIQEDIEELFSSAIDLANTYILTPIFQGISQVIDGLFSSLTNLITAFIGGFATFVSAIFQVPVDLFQQSWELALQGFGSITLWGVELGWILAPLFFVGLWIVVILMVSWTIITFINTTPADWLFRGGAQE